VIFKIYVDKTKLITFTIFKNYRPKTVADNGVKHK